MRPAWLEVEVPQIRTADNAPVRTNLEIAWRLHSSIRGRLSHRMRATLLMREAERKQVVEETVILMARQIVSSYTIGQITPATARVAASTPRPDPGEAGERHPPGARGIAHRHGGSAQETPAGYAA